MWLPIVAVTACGAAKRAHQRVPFGNFSLWYNLLLYLGILIVLVTIAVALSDASETRTSERNWVGAKRSRYGNGTLRTLVNGDSAESLQFTRLSLSAISTEKLLSYAVIQLGQLLDSVRRDLIGLDASVHLLSRRGRNRRRSRLRYPSVSSIGIGSNSTKVLSFSKQTLPASESRANRRRRRAAKTIDVKIRMQTPKQMKTANKIQISFRSSSPLFWKRVKPSRKTIRKKKRKEKKKREKKRRKKQRKRAKKRKEKRRRKKKAKEKREKARKGLMDIRMKGKALKSRQKKVSAKKFLKKTIAKQLKRKMRRMSRRAKKRLAKMKKSKKARKRLFRSQMANAIRSTVRQAEQVCKSLIRTARQRIGSLREKVDCRFDDAERLVKRLEKSRATNNNRKLTKDVSGIMAAVASQMLPLVDVLYQQTLAHHRTFVILRRLHNDVAKILRRLLRQAFGLRRALDDAIIADWKLPIQRKYTTPSSSSKTVQQLHASIDSMEAGTSKETMIDTVARVVSVVSQMFRRNVEDLLKVYRLRYITEKKLESAESWCGGTESRIGCINANVFRVLERMAARSSSLVRNINRILPAHSKRKAAFPKMIHVDDRLLKETGSEKEVKRASASRVSRVILGVARNLRLVVGRLKEAVIRKKFKALLKDKNKAEPSSQRKPKRKPKRKPSAKLLSLTPTTAAVTVPPASTVRKTAAGALLQVVGSMKLKPLNRVMLSALRSLEKWSRLLYLQTAKNPDEEEPEPIYVDELSSASAHKSAEQAALVVAAVTRRLRIVGQRVGKIVQKKLDERKTTQAKVKHVVTSVGKKLKSIQKLLTKTVKKLKPAKSKSEKKVATKEKLPVKQKPTKKQLPVKQKSKKDKKKKQQKVVTLKQVLGKSKKGKAASKKPLPIKEKGKEKSKKGKKTPKSKKGKAASASKKPLPMKEKGKEKSKKGKEAPQQKETTASKKKPEKQKETKPKVTPAGTEKKAKQKATEPETRPGHVINRDDMAAELVKQSRELAETVRGIVSKVDDAVNAGDDHVKPETSSEAENLWIRFMNERLKAANTTTQKKKAKKALFYRLLPFRVGTP